ncbi:ribonuclease H-like protein, partial [Aureobasidium melanogenum]
MARTGQQLPFGQSILDFDDLETLGQEIVQLCDGIEKTGLVDYQMGVAEERIVDLLLKCLVVAHQRTMGFPDTPVELPDGRLVCEDHGLQICHQCFCDYTFLNDHSEQSSSIEEPSTCSEDDIEQRCQMAEPAAPILEGAAARFNPNSQASAYCEECGLTWMVATPDFADQEDVFQDCPFHNSLEADRAERRTLFVHIDGACPGNGTKSAVGGIGIYFGPSSPYNLSALVTRNFAQPPTSQQAELTAATRALELIREKCMPARRQLVNTYILCPCHTECWAMSFPFRIVIITDSAYLFDCMTSHLMVWRWDPKIQVYTNKKSGKSIINSRYIRNIVKAVEMLAERGVQVLWKKVPRALNLEADRLAKAGAKIQRSGFKVEKPHSSVSQRSCQWLSGLRMLHQASGGKEGDM